MSDCNALANPHVLRSVVISDQGHVDAINLVSFSELVYKRRYCLNEEVWIVYIEVARDVDACSLIKTFAPTVRLFHDRKQQISKLIKLFSYPQTTLTDA